MAFKLAERVAFLTKPSMERLSTFYKIKELYNKRSRFVHQGGMNKPIAKDDCDTLEEIISVVFDKLKLMLFTGWETIRETGNPSTSVIDYINNYTNSIILYL
jgi:hypothetical protein